jgi:sec-independent protein translocase protein TatB
MSFFGIGPMELIFILIIMILVLGPKNMVVSAQKLGVTLRKIVKSPLWATVMDTSREIREIPTRLIRDAGIEEDLKNIKSTTDSLKHVGNFSVPINPISVNLTPKDLKEKTNTILPVQPEEEQEITAEEQEINSESAPSEINLESQPEQQDSDTTENLET